MLKEAIDDALRRGERLKKDIVGEILSSAAFNDLVNNKRFVDTVAKVIHTKDEIGRSVRKNVQEALRLMKVPSKDDIADYERRVQSLERQIDLMGRKLMAKRLNRKGPRRKAARAKARAKRR